MPRRATGKTTKLIRIPLRYEEKVKNFIAQLLKEETEVKSQPKPRNSRTALTSAATNEWYTPPEFVELARQVLGDIDLDPASNEIVQQWMGRHKYWNEKLE